jgi:hypothetical protein
MGAGILACVCVAGVGFLLWFLAKLCRDHEIVSARRVVPTFPQRAKPESTWSAPFPGATYDYRGRTQSDLMGRRRAG